MDNVGIWLGFYWTRKIVYILWARTTYLIVNTYRYGICSHIQALLSITPIQAFNWKEWSHKVHYFIGTCLVNLWTKSEGYEWNIMLCELRKHMETGTRLALHLTSGFCENKDFIVRVKYSLNYKPNSWPRRHAEVAPLSIYQSFKFQLLDSWKFHCLEEK